MKSILTFLLLGTLSLAAQAVAAGDDGFYAVELAGIGFAFEDSCDFPQAFMLKVLSRVQGPESSETIEGEEPIQQQTKIQPFAIRVGYTTYLLDIVELSANYLEANVHSVTVNEKGQLAPAERIGTLKLALALFAGLPGGKGKLSLGNTDYSVVFYKSEVLDGLYRWAPELEK